MVAIGLLLQRVERNRNPNQLPKQKSPKLLNLPQQLKHQKGTML